MSQVRHHSIFKKFECWKGFVEEGFNVNFLGVKTRAEYACEAPPGSGNRFVATALPDFDEEYFEWVDLLEAVVGARDRYTMIELGAGYGRWLVNAAAAIRHIKGPPYRLIGVEAEPTHFRWMKQHMQDNGVKGSDCDLIEAAVNDKDGNVGFFIGKPSDWYGQRIWQLTDVIPLFLPRRLFRSTLARIGLERRHSAAQETATGNNLSFFQKVAYEIAALNCSLIPRVKEQADPLYEHSYGRGLGIGRVKAVGLNTLLRQLDKVDLIDLDVEGSELRVLKPAAGQLNEKVRRLHVGTHNRKIESGLRTLFRRNGWKNQFDYPINSNSHTPWGTIRFQNGVQSWINRDLLEA